jgi:hypothetical protein
MNEQPSEWAMRLRNATNETARVFARRGLATAIGKLARGILVARGVPADVADDDANFLAFDVVRRVEGGRVEGGREDAYVRQCAKNRANDYYRETSGVRAVYELREEAEEIADGRDPESLMADYQEAAAVARQVDRLRALIATAPLAHAAVLYEVHVKGTLIEAIARRELEERIARGAEHVRDAAALKRARAAVDQRLSRARAWIRERIEFAPARRVR